MIEGPDGVMRPKKAHNKYMKQLKKEEMKAKSKFIVHVELSFD